MMTDLKFTSPSGETTIKFEETGRIGTVAPKTKLHIRKTPMTEITLKLTVDELKMIDKYVELKDETRPLFNKIRNAYPKPTTLFDVIRNLGYSIDMCYEIVDAVEEFEKSKEPEEEPEELKTLYQMLDDKKHHPDTCVFICDIVKEWMSQYTHNVMTGEYLKGYEECLTVLEENLK